MATTTYDNIVDYLMACQAANDKYQRYCAIQDALELQMVASASGQQFDSYELDDGQSKVKATVKDFNKIVDMIQAIEVLKERIVNNNIGAVHVNRDLNAINSISGLCQ